MTIVTSGFPLPYQVGDKLRGNDNKRARDKRGWIPAFAGMVSTVNTEIATSFTGEGLAKTVGVGLLRYARNDMG